MHLKTKLKNSNAHIQILETSKMAHFFLCETFKRLEVILEILRHIVTILEILKAIFNISMVLGAIFIFFLGHFSGLKGNVSKIRKMTFSVKCFMPKQTIPNIRKNELI